MSSGNLNVIIEGSFVADIKKARDVAGVMVGWMDA